jgi:hypothetical protein
MARQKWLVFRARFPSCMGESRGLNRA